MKNLKLLLSLISLLALSVTASSCSWFGSEDEEGDIQDEYANKTDEQIYAEAKENMENGSYAKASEVFQEIEKLYPFSALANKAKVMNAYSYYKDEEYDKAIDAIDTFVQFNPGSDEVMFMYYLKAICYYDRITDVKRDQDITRKAKETFEELISRFPDSRYARDAKYKLYLIRDHLAGKEMEIGRYYLKTDKPLAAMNRFKNVVRQFQETSMIEEALYRLVENNLMLGFDDEAVKYAAVLGHNYPDGKWYKRAYKLLNDKDITGGGNFLKNKVSEMREEIDEIQVRKLNDEEVKAKSEELIEQGISAE